MGANHWDWTIDAMDCNNQSGVTMKSVEPKPYIHATQFSQTIGEGDWRKVEDAVRPIWESLNNILITLKTDVEFRHMLDNALEQMSDHSAVEVGAFMHRVTEEIFNL